MKSKHLGRIILLGTIVLGCLLILQVYWFKKAFDVSEKQFDHSVQVALKKVADSISLNSEVKRLSSNFFFVSTESELNDQELDVLLKREFLLRQLSLDYELGIYNAADDTLVYGNYVESTRKHFLKNRNADIPARTEEKNFAVYFPKKDSYIAAQLDIWIFSTAVLLLMMGFFAYAIYSLLREKRFSSLKNDFINNMTHEFRTPVTNIRIAADILKNKMTEENGMNVYVDILLKENEKLRQKIDHVLLGSSVEHIKNNALETIDVHQIIRDCADAFQLKIHERNGSILLDFNASDTFILGDKELLTQAIINVIDNAEKYSSDEPRIIVRTRNCDGRVEIGILDKGVGIPSNMKSKVFEKFFRVQSGDVHNVKGFGLGLSFVKSVIGSHKGKIILLSEVNHGTEVRIILPTT